MYCFLGSISNSVLTKSVNSCLLVGFKLKQNTKLEINLVTLSCDCDLAYSDNSISSLLMCPLVLHMTV